jgi:hypothetical protein
MMIETEGSAEVATSRMLARFFFTSSDLAWTVSATRLRLRSQMTRLPPNMDSVLTDSANWSSSTRASSTRRICAEMISASASGPAAFRALS